jgi:hypothetical protein
MKRALSWVLVLTLVVICACPSAFAAGAIDVSVDGNYVVWSDAVPFIDENNRTLCPLRAVAEAMGLDVDWDPVTREAIFSERGYYEDGTEYIFMLTFTVGSTVAHWNEYYEDADSVWGGISDIEMDTAAVIRNDRSYAPVRYLAEAFGFDVDWDAPSRTVLITSVAEYIVYWGSFACWGDSVGIYYYPGERFDEFGSVEVVSATVNGVPAAVEVMSAAELDEMNEYFQGGGVYAFYIYGDFDEGETYFVDWDTKWTYSDGTVDPELENVEWVFYCDGYGGW